MNLDGKCTELSAGSNSQEVLAKSGLRHNVIDACKYILKMHLFHLPKIRRYIPTNFGAATLAKIGSGDSHFVQLPLADLGTLLIACIFG